MEKRPQAHTPLADLANNANGGDVMLTVSGVFTYDPPSGFEGTNSFNSTLTDDE